jgi:acyl carrier protein
VNNYMRENWVPNLVKISEVIKIEEIPVLGTGKTDYKVLKKMISFEEKKDSKYNLKNIEETLKKKISELSWIDISKIEKNKEFWKDIHIDSIDVWELMIFIRKSYNIETQIKVENIKTFWDLVQIVEDNKK